MTATSERIPVFVKKGASRPFHLRLGLWSALLGAACLFAALYHVGPVHAQSGVGYVEYYIPADEDDLMNALKDIPNSGVNLGWTGANMNTAVDIISSSNDINVYLDEWEDGYDLNLADPYNTADARWCVTDGNELDMGEVLTLNETDTFAPGSQGVNARDRVYITGGPVNVVRTVWPDYSPGTYIAGSWELFPTIAWESNYTVPVGADTELPAGEYPFLYAYLFVQAMQDNTRVVVNDPYFGGIEIDTVLNQGETLMYPQTPYPPQGGPQNTCHQGTTVVATDSVSGAPANIQANITTSSNKVYDFRYFTLTPVEYLGSSYFVPVPSMTMDASEASSLGHPIDVDTAIYIYSFQDNTDVWVETLSGITQLDADLDAGEVIRYVMPQADTANGVFEGDYGARIFINNPSAGDKIWSVGAGDDNRPDMDWGFQVLNPEYLTAEYFLPWAPSNPTHITPVYDNTIFYVDWNLDGTADETFTLHRFQNKMLYPPSTPNPNTGENYDGTGAHVWANRKFVLAWGQDHTERTTGPENDNFPPDFDWGHAILPLYWYDPVLSLDKTADPTSLGPSGGTVTFTIVVTSGDYTVYNLDITDVLPDGWEYVDDSTTITLSYGTGGSGDGYDPSISGSTLTWDLGGLGLNDTMPPNATVTLSFDGQTLAGQYSCGPNLNRGEAYGTDGTGGVFRPRDTAIVDIVCLEITKTSDTGGQPVQPGDTITYTIDITNNSSTTQTGIMVTDPLPSYTDYVAQSTVVQGYVATGGSQTVRDEFGTVSYGNNDGTMNWSNFWQEFGDTGSSGASDGRIQVTGGELRMCDRPDSGNRPGVWREADLSGATSATFSFDYRTSGNLEDNDRLRVRVYNGSSWRTLQTFSNDGSGSPSYDITSDISANTRVRFQVQRNCHGSDEYFYVDNAEIEVTYPGSGSTAVTKDNIPGGANPDLSDGDPPTLVDATDSFILEPSQTMTVIFQVQVEDYIPSYINEIENEACVTSDQISEQLCDSVMDRPTLVFLNSFNTYDDGGQTVVEWQTAGEIGTVGFFLKRLDEETGNYVRVNDRLLPGLLHSPQGGTYRVIDEEAVPGGTYTYKLVEVEAKGKKRKYGPFTVIAGEEGLELSKGKKERILSESMSSRFMKKARKMSARKKARIKARKLARKAARAFKKKRKGPMAKMAVRDKGLYFVGASELASVLNVPEQKVKRLIPNNRLALTNRGKQVAYVPAGDGSGIYFYGQGIESIYTDENIYWLKKGKGLLVEQVAGKGPSPSSGIETFIEMIHVEEDQWALTALYDDPKADYWLWDFVIAGNGATTFSFQANGGSGSGSAVLKVYLKGGSDTEADMDHHAVVSLNGTEIGSGRFDGTDDDMLELPFDASLLIDGENSIEVAGVLDTGVPYSFFLVDSFDLSYQRYYQAVDNRLFVRGEGNPVVTISGFTSPDIHLFELSDPLRPKHIKAITVDEEDGGYRISFKPAGPDLPYLALTLEAAGEPISLTADNPSRLKRKGNRAEYVVITPSEFTDTAQSLADYREGQGLNVMVVELEDIYDEFNDGISSPKAIRDFLSYAYDNWRDAPRYVLLAGEGTYDYKDNQGHGDNLVPVMMVNTPYGLFASDNRFVDVRGDDGVPEMAIGRLPVMTAEELEAAISKIMAYESGGGDWAHRVLMIADDPDGGGNFTADSEDIASILPPEYTVEKIYLSEYSLVEAREMFQEGIDSGALLVNFIGHAGLDRLCEEGMLLTGDVAYLNNGDKLPVVTAMTCVVGRFAVPGFDSLSEALVLRQGGGAIALWSPTGLSINAEARILDQKFFRAVFEDGEKTLGGSILKALDAYAGRGGAIYMLQIYNLLGDPALEMR